MIKEMVGLIVLLVTNMMLTVDTHYNVMSHGKKGNPQAN